MKFSPGTITASNVAWLQSVLIDGQERPYCLAAGQTRDEAIARCNHLCEVLNSAADLDSVTAQKTVILWG